MKTKFPANSGSRPSALKIGAAHLRSRLARQLTQGTSSHVPVRFDSSLSLFNSLWTPLRLDLLKVPVTRRRD
jgi:hypothetical protein